MAQKSQKKAKDAGNLRERAVETMLALSAARGWNALKLQDIAREMGTDLATLHDAFADRFDLLAAYGRILDRHMLESAPAAPTGSPRDILFDLLMERFDRLQQDRAGVCAILNDLKLDPKSAIIGLPHLGRSMAWALDAAGIETSGLSGALKIAGLAAAYLDTARHWLKDDSEDLSKTMAALDRNLTRAEDWGRTFRLI